MRTTPNLPTFPHVTRPYRYTPKQRAAFAANVPQYSMYLVVLGFGATYAKFTHKPDADDLCLSLNRCGIRAKVEGVKPLPIVTKPAPVAMPAVVTPAAVMSPVPIIELHQPRQPDDFTLLVRLQNS